VQEADELELLAAGDDPATGEPFGTDVRRIFDTYLERHVPARNEAVVTIVGGTPYRHSPADPPYRLDLDAEVVSGWAGIATSERGSIETPEGKVDYLAMPLRAGDATRGVFVTAFFHDLGRRGSDAAFWAAGAVGLAVLLVGSLLAWRLSERVLGPVAAVTETARRISEGDLGERIPVSGRDEVARLAETLNGMLDRLESAFAGQRRFLDDAGHELKTPITIVRGHVELLGDDPEERAETQALVLDELDRMSRLVNDLLILARWERPDFLEPAPVDVGELTDECLQKISALGRREWVLEARGKGEIVADRQRLTQAVVQLADNAVRHTEEGAPISLGSDLVGGEARFWVRDRGPGIAPEEAERVFERFHRGRGADRSDGAGLGLSIVEAIARAHRGRMELESRAGEGSVFTVYVPARGPARDG
jgi:signal transduction histidine kinase